MFATSVAICASSVVSFAATDTAIGSGAVNGTVNGDVTNDNVAYNLITNFSNKMKQNGSFKVHEYINTSITVTDGSTSETDSSDITKITSVNGDKMMGTINAVKYENGIKGADETANLYAYRDGDKVKTFEVTPTGEVTRLEQAYAPLADMYFPIKFHGNETVTLEGNEYVVTGFLTKEDYGNSITSEVTDDLSMSGLDATELIGNIPYVCRFNATTGDLTLMKIDMSGVLNGMTELIKSLGAEGIPELAGFGMSGTMTYTSTISVEATDVVIPENLK